MYFELILIVRARTLCDLLNIKFGLNQDQTFGLNRLDCWLLQDGKESDRRVTDIGAGTFQTYPWNL